MFKHWASNAVALCFVRTMTHLSTYSLSTCKVRGCHEHDSQGMIFTSNRYSREWFSSYSQTSPRNLVRSRMVHIEQVAQTELFSFVMTSIM